MEIEVDAFFDTVDRPLELVFSEELKSLLSKDMLVDAPFAVRSAVEAFFDALLAAVETLPTTTLVDRSFLERPEADVNADPALRFVALSPLDKLLIRDTCLPRCVDIAPIFELAVDKLVETFFDMVDRPVEAFLETVLIAVALAFPLLIAVEMFLERVLLPVKAFLETVLIEAANVLRPVEAFLETVVIAVAFAVPRLSAVERDLENAAVLLSAVEAFFDMVDRPVEAFLETVLIAVALAFPLLIAVEMFLERVLLPVKAFLETVLIEAANVLRPVEAFLETVVIAVAFAFALLIAVEVFFEAVLIAVEFADAREETVDRLLLISEESTRIFFFFVSISRLTKSSESSSLS